MQESKDSGSFITGFGMGLITGAAAYFLFGTDQGKELRKRALAEWESAQLDLEHIPGFEPPKKLKQLLKEVTGYFATALTEIETLKESESVSKTAVRKRSEAKPKTNSRFKGV